MRKVDEITSCFRSLTVFSSIGPFHLIARTMSLPCTLRLRIKQAIIGLLITDGLSRRQIVAGDSLLLQRHWTHIYNHRYNLPQ